MQNTQRSLLEHAQSGESAAWQRLAELYKPLIASWAARHTNSREDAEDLAQEILLEMIRYLPRFEHSGRPGAFRAWLRTIAIHCTHDFHAARRREPIGSGETAVLGLLHELQDPVSEPARSWDREHDQAILHGLLQEVAGEFEPATMQAFRRLALEDQSGEAVARDLNMSIGAVYVAKSRVLKRLRQLSAGLLDWSEAATR